MSKAQYSEIYAEYLLGFLGRSAQAQFEAHLATCPECRTEVHEIAETLGALPLSLPVYSPRPLLKRKLFSELDIPLKPVLQTGPPSKISVVWKVWSVVAILLIVAIGALLYQEHIQRKDGQQRIVNLRFETEKLRIENEELNSQVGQLTRPGLRFVRFESRPGYEGISGHAFLYPPEDYARLFVFGLPPLAPDQRYQLWVLEEGQPPQPSELFSSDGPKTDLDIHLPVGVDRISSLWVTVEPRQGSPAPTGAEVLTGNPIR